MQLVFQRKRRVRRAAQRAPASPGAAGYGAALKTANVNGVTVVTNAQGFTLYSFAPDTATG